MPNGSQSSSEPISPPPRWAPREEESYVRAKALISPDAARFDELAEAAIAQIERAAADCPEMTAEPLATGHGPLRVSQGSRSPATPELEIFFTIHDGDDGVCSLWDVRIVPDDDDPF